ncbi:N-6 DNA methylase [Actinomadura rugatobispora]|uniref:N-6 DNA methylase n=1 Tax=Actinomadura rugatobispora TaxID=1994 RepID=A0ABW1A1W7_9ACTN|nr:N-6 DNA methylase [Actinomadura rugatobispora]
MASQSEQLTAAEISRLAGVTRATVSNWRRRHPDFPQPSGGTEASPSYDRRRIEAWLAARGRLPARSSRDDLRAHLHGRTPCEAGAVALFTAHLAGLDARKRAQTATLDDDELTAMYTQAVSSTGPGGSGHVDVPATLLRSAADVTHEEGPLAVFDVLEEHTDAPLGIRGTHLTPEVLADLMAGLATSGGPRVRSVLDPACGSGRLLAATAAALTPGAGVHGQEYRPVTAAQAKTRLAETAPKVSVDVRTGDSLRHDAFPGLHVDAVVCNPPYGDRDWGHDELALDTRWAYGVPPRSEPELAWVQHALAHLAEGGHAVLLLPPATASRSSGRRIRAELLRQGALCAIIALPPGLAVPHHIGLHLWILRRSEAGRPGQDRVLLMDASDEAAADEPSGQGRTSDTGRLHATVLSTWQAFVAPTEFTEVPGTARAVPTIDLLDDLVDLSPARHVRTAPMVTPDAALRDVLELAERLKADVAALTEASEIGPLASAGEASRTWRSATVADLARGGALAVHRGTRAASADTPPTDLADRPVLRARDLLGGTRAGGDTRETRLADPVVIEAGDVLITQVVGPQGVATRVAGDDDAGCLLGNGVFLLRPDPARLNPWFLAGFVSAPDNVSQATTGSSTHQLVASRLRVPLLPLDEQTAYGQAFRKLHDLRASARNAATCADEMADLMATALSSGALLPHGAELP